MAPTPYAVLAIVFRKKILLVKDEFERWTLPEIKIRSDNHSTRPALDLADELGIECEFISIPGVVSIRDQGIHRILNIIRFKAKKMKISGDHDAKWVSLKKIDNIDQLSHHIIDNLIINTNSTYYMCKMEDNVVKSFESI